MLIARAFVGLHINMPCKIDPLRFEIKVLVAIVIVLGLTSA